jgi:hypothetical protein
MGLESILPRKQSNDSFVFEGDCGTPFSLPSLISADVTRSPATVAPPPLGVDFSCESKKPDKAPKSLTALGLVLRMRLTFVPSGLVMISTLSPGDAKEDSETDALEAAGFFTRRARKDTKFHQPKHKTSTIKAYNALTFFAIRSHIDFSGQRGLLTNRDLVTGNGSTAAKLPWKRWFIF